MGCDLQPTKIMKLLIIFSIIIISLALFWQFSKYFPCPSWLGWMVEMENPFARENRSNAIIKTLNLKPNMTVADIGCGPGRVTLPLAQKLPNGKVIAIDLQQEMLDRVKAKIGELTNIELRNQNIITAPLEPNTYDRILLVNVLGEVPDEDAALKNIFTALKKDGIISLTETVFDPHYQRKSKLKKQLESHGFTNITFFGPWYSYTVHGTK